METNSELTFKIYCRKFMTLCGGICLGAAWILFIDGALNITKNDEDMKFEWYFTVPMIINTIGIIMTNLIDTNLLNPGNWLYGENVSQKTRVWFLSSFVVTFCGLLGSLWIMIERFIQKKDQLDPGAQFTGVAIFVSTVIATIGSLMFVLGKTFNSADEYEEI